MFRKTIVFAAFALMPLLGACDLDPVGPETEHAIETWGNALGDSWW